MMLLNNAHSAEQLLKRMANRNRLMVLCTLMDQELSVGELNQRVPLSQSALSQHLSVLRDAGLVATRKEAQTVYYRVDDPRVGKILDALYSIFCQ
ncbi:transcriptional regulator [Aestuariirhabdus litorea]|uniref:Transcriptional regulator n=2 Tax=Aestuariirhabdus litorea TaxID=2528527 RepID=A0A3P3VS54_9GAMM|nr:transcriptional regulator [Aestuariirhabdus litorea]RWW98679.1 ArsR family transcriptional regulator [Endozoicomonadaceae bacterium GTF-13]